MFKRYQHVERFGTEEVEGILDGICHIFYKIDGTNASIWYNEVAGVSCGSRNRELSFENDNAGFMNWVWTQRNIRDFVFENQYLRLYGEWLVPHSLKTYREDAWRRFYVFDVVDTRDNSILSYEAYQPILEAYGIDYIPPLAIIKMPKEEDLYRCLEKSGQFLIEDGKGKGEGIVVKNYDFVNRYGRQIWAKIVTNEFKEVHHKEMGAPLINGTSLLEEKIIEEFLTEEFIRKEKSKLELLNDGWHSKLIPQLLGVVWYEFIREESWNFLKKHKMPKLNFKFMQQLAIRKVKEVCNI